MKHIPTWKALVFIGTLASIAFLIKSKTDRRIVQAPPPEILNNAHDNSQTSSASIVNKPLAWSEFSTEARQTIANTIANQNEVEFDKNFSVECLSANKVDKRFEGYGIQSEVVVVSARFRISSKSDNQKKWIKVYDISETFDARNFQGLSSPATVQSIVGSLKEQIQEDNQTVSLLTKRTEP